MSAPKSSFSFPMLETVTDVVPALRSLIRRVSRTYPVGESGSITRPRSTAVTIVDAIGGAGMVLLKLRPVIGSCSFGRMILSMVATPGSATCIVSWKPETPVVTFSSTMSMGTIWSTSPWTSLVTSIETGVAVGGGGGVGDAVGVGVGVSVGVGVGVAVGVGAPTAVAATVGVTGTVVGWVVAAGGA